MHTPVVMGDALRALADQAAVFEALLLIASAIHKAIKWSHLLGAVRRFAGITPSLAPAVLAGVSVLELTTGGLLFVPSLQTIGALLATVIWTTYMVLIVRAIGQGRRHVDCGCSFGQTLRPLGSYQVARNAVLIGLAVGVGAAGGRVGAGAQATQVLAACALLVLYGALDQVMGLQPLRGGELL